MKKEDEDHIVDVLGQIVAHERKELAKLLAERDAAIERLTQRVETLEREASARDRLEGAVERALAGLERRVLDAQRDELRKAALAVSVPNGAGRPQ